MSQKAIQSREAAALFPITAVITESFRNAAESQHLHNKIDEARTKRLRMEVNTQQR